MERTGDALAALGGDVTVETFPGARHALTDGEVAAVESRLAALLDG
ncbi:hypothetical protein J2752_002312 [Halarchaeum rubridurum]|uniref:Phospholipase/carboxylesterase n=1 Tax=Halarchaeum rubridurum TaxID=489911 RepID=A0A830G249_9EURY|nr:hypothetical protein [Halarchaeum rubridurum]GGM71993.1 hypothetical protein GCM10009017_22420 [Halarchaeum rubridurum]